jgi:hypothetical protein
MGNRIQSESPGILCRVISPIMGDQAVTELVAHDRKEKGNKLISETKHA